MIKTIKDRHTMDVYQMGRSRSLPLDVLRRATRKLEYVDLAKRLDDLCLRFADGDAYNVEITDYHGIEVLHEHRQIG